MVGGQLHHPEGEVADALQLGGDPHDGDDEAEVGGHRLLAGEQVVAPLRERHLHGVDLVVGGEGQVGLALVPVEEHRAHALEVLVHADAHDLHLQAELFELGLIGRSGRRHLFGVSRIGR